MNSQQTTRGTDVTGTGRESPWKTLSSVTLAKNAGSAYHIIVKNLAHIDPESGVKKYYDIRQWYRNYPTRQGVCLTPEEYSWLLKNMDISCPEGTIKRRELRQENIVSIENLKGGTMKLRLVKPWGEFKEVELSQRQIIDLRRRTDHEEPDYVQIEKPIEQIDSDEEPTKKKQKAF